MANNDITPEERQAWLVEYQVCQKLIQQHQSQYWTIFGIFIGISTAVLGWIANSMTNGASLTINENLLTIGQVISLNKQVVITVLGVSFIIIIWIFKIWLKRVAYTEKLNYLRMREIELDFHLDMRQGWRIHALDKWHEFKNEFKKRGYTINNIPDPDWLIFINKLQKGLSNLSNKDYCVILHGKQDIIKEIISKSDEQRCFEWSFHKLHYFLLTNTLISLWLFLIVNVWSSGWYQFFYLIPFAFFVYTIIYFIFYKGSSL